MRRSRALGVLAALALAGAATAEPPKRVVSVNLCTDQLALLLAGPDQLISISRLGHDPASSAMAAQAQHLASNGSGAEEVYLLRPDLVVAGTFTAGSTVQMLRNLGIKVEQFAPANALADVPDRLRQMGRVLGQQAKAETLITEFEAQIEALDDRPQIRPRAAVYYVNSYTSGDRTLAGDILRMAGFDNVAAEAGFERGGTLPLESLVMLAPDVIIQGRNYPGQARAEDNLSHPALRALDNTVIAGELTDRDWICGTPNVLNAVHAMRDLRRSLAVEE